MRVVIDTNVFVSALISGRTAPAMLLEHWHKGRFALLTAEEQLDEIRRVTRYAKIGERIKPGAAVRLVNDLRKIATLVERLPDVSSSLDPWDNYLLAIAQAGGADWLISGDKPGLLTLGQHGATRIMTVRDFLSLI